MVVGWVDVSEAQRFASDKFQKVNLFETERMFCDVYCFEPGQEREVELVAYAGDRAVYGFAQKVMGQL